MIQHFLLYRRDDVTGVSGPGVVADGWLDDQPFTIATPEWTLLLPPGWVRLEWRGELTSTAFYRDLDMLLAIHGHNGATVVVWADDTTTRLELVREIVDAWNEEDDGPDAADLIERLRPLLQL